MIKGNGGIPVNGVYYRTEKGTQVINSTEPLLLTQEKVSQTGSCKIITQKVLFKYKY